MESNVDLYSRFGRGVRNPSQEERHAALRELFVEDNPHCTEADYAEHPEASLSYGHDNPESEDYVWTVYTISVYRDGSGIYTKYRDQDDDEPEFEHRLTGLTLREATELWALLADGKTDAVQERTNRNS
jgi:hypothetical protein